MKVTVFTPTYNRAYIIQKLYKSLQNQTSKKFEWLVVDDGSSDKTYEMIKSWEIEEKEFAIRYYKQENGGKCRAINNGLAKAKGDLFFTVDSDDYLVENAIEKILEWAESLPCNKNFCGVVGNLGTTETFTPNKIFNSPYRDASLLERYYHNSNDIIDGERAFAFFTDIHRKYYYPEYEGENFMTPAVTWNRMASDGYVARFFNDIIWVYEYQESGLTLMGNKKFLDNPKGHGLWLRELAEFSKFNYYKKYRMYYTYYCDFSRIISINEIADNIGCPIIIIKMAALIHSISRKMKFIIGVRNE